MNILTEVLCHHDRTQTLSIEDWNKLVRFARYNNMLGTISEILQPYPQDNLPEGLDFLLAAEKARSDYFQQQTRRELKHLERVSAQTSAQIVLLKGAAYIAQKMQPSFGRRPSDVDILVPKAEFEAVETNLIANGWDFSEDLTDYDQYYYRSLAHELPPMRHRFRAMELDVHHNLCSPISRIKIPAEKLFEEAIPVPNSNLYTLSKRDLLLHSGLHLFFNDELRGGIRDLYDMHLLTGEIIKDREDLEFLIERAEQLNVTRPLYYALKSLATIFNTPLPSGWEQQIQPLGPNGVTNWLMTKLIRQTLAPPTVEQHNSWWVHNALLARSHWLRMPPGVLLKHSLHKLRNPSSKH